MSSPQKTGTISFLNQWLILIATLLIIGGYIAYFQTREYRQIDAQERLRLSAQTETVEKNILPQLHITYGLIDGIIKDFPIWQAEKNNDEYANRFLKTLDNATVGISPIIVIDAGGNVIASSEAKLIGMNFAHREYFKTALKNPDPDILHISAPFRTTLGTYVISLYRTIHGPHGEFAGIVIVSAVPEYFATILNSVCYTSDMWAGIAHGDGQLFLLSPARQELRGNDLANSGALLMRHRESGKVSNVFTGIMYAAGEKRMAAFRTIQSTSPPTDKPLVVVVTRNLDALFAPWRKNTYLQALLFTAFTIVCSLGMRTRQRRQRAQFSALHQAEAALQESEYFFKESQRAASIGSYRCDFVKGIWASSDILDSIFGIDKEYNRSIQGWLDIVHPDDRQMMDQYLNEEVIANRNSFAKEYRVVRRNDGVTRWVFGLGEVTFDENSSSLQMIGTIQDITERKMAEQSLQQERDLSMDILNAQPAGIYRIRVFARETWENDAWLNSRNTPYSMELITESFCSILGITKEAYEHNPGILLDMVHPDDKEGFARRNEDANVNLHKFAWEGRLLINGMIRWVFFQSLPRPLENGDVLWTGALMDITERKKIEEEKYALEQQFQQTQKLESLGVLSGGIAHDFNNILAIIMGNCSLAKMHEENAGKYIPEIEKASQRAAELCRQMLAYAGKAQFVQANVNFRSLVSDMVDMLKKTIPQNVEVKLESSTDIPFIQGDSGQLYQIVMNLIINASEAIGKDPGEISVALAKTTIPEGHTELDYSGKAISPGVYVCLEVTDNGCGMDEETKLRIFEPFYTTKFTGRGLGMSAVLGSITSHRGALQLHSKLGLGTSFKVFLPVQKSDSGQDGSEPQKSDSPWQGSGTILLVEDEDQIRYIARTLLEMFGFTVVEAVNGKEALDLYLEHASEVALVLTDMGMPIMDGCALFHALKQYNHSLPIVISSGFGDADVTSRFGNDEIAGVISKPYTPDKLRELLKSILDSAPAARR
ncbi:MAG: response regulator [Deltaproteobacteria bacterium]|nr:response regulator [Deltaproteobacteria bacterium]TLN03266.1 MAG: response regulator [bacterium]